MRTWIEKNWALIAFRSLGAVLCFEALTCFQTRLIKWVVFLAGAAVIIAAKRINRWEV